MPLHCLNVVRPWLSSSEARGVEGGLEGHHLDGGHRGVLALVAGLRAGALDGLLDGVGGEHAERDRDARRERYVSDALRDLAGDVVEVGVEPRMTAARAMMPSTRRARLLREASAP